MNAIVQLAHTARSLRGVSARTTERAEAQRAHARNVRAASEPERERLEARWELIQRQLFQGRAA
jgi:hypothetical protein